MYIEFMTYIEQVEHDQNGGRTGAEIERLRKVLKDILKVAELGQIPDRHGSWHSACSETCLNDIRITAKIALGE